MVHTSVLIFTKLNSINDYVAKFLFPSYTRIKIFLLKANCFITAHAYVANTLICWKIIFHM